METRVNHDAQLRTVLEEWERFANRSGGDEEPKVFSVIDDERGHYLLMNVGWSGKRRICSVMFYARLHNNKIWVEEDWTEEGIANELVKAGVPREDIVLGFQPPSMRPLTEFAAS